MKNWAGNFTFTAADIHRPKSISELQRLVSSARKIRPIGTGHSFNGIADSPGDIVDLRGIDPDIRIDRNAMTATVGGGTTYTQLALELQKNGLALHNLASLPHITIAGAIATATHGSGDQNQTLASAVAALELVTSDGAIKNVVKGDADFNALVVGLGAFGIVSRVTLDIIPTFDLVQNSFIDLPWDKLIENFDTLSSASYSMSIFTNWGRPVADRIWMKSKTQLESLTEKLASLHLNRGGPFPLPLASPNPHLRFNEFERAGPWSERLAHFRHDASPMVEQVQSEYLIPRSKLAESVSFLHSIASRIDPFLYASEIRTMAADEFWLSPAYKNDQIGLHFTWKTELDIVYPLCREIEESLIPLGAKPHWGKVMHADAATLAPLYPRMADFRACANRYDSTGKFRNAYLERHVFG